MGPVSCRKTSSGLPLILHYSELCNYFIIYITMYQLEKEMQPSALFLPGKSHGQRNLVRGGYCSWGLKRVGDDWVTKQQKCNDNRNKGHNKCNRPESSPNFSRTPTPPCPVHGKIILWESGPWCQKGRGPLLWPFHWCFPLDSLRSHCEHLQSGSQPTIWENLCTDRGRSILPPCILNIPP